MARHGVIALATKHVPHKSFDPLNAGFLTSQVVNMFPNVFSVLLPLAGMPPCA